MIFPATCADKTTPWGDIRRFTYSITSRNSSFLLYFIPSFLQPICPVTWLVIAVCSSLVADLTPCWVIRVLRIPESVFWGYLQKTCPIDEIPQISRPFLTQSQQFHPTAHKLEQSYSLHFLPLSFQSNFGRFLPLSEETRTPS